MQALVGLMLASVIVMTMSTMYVSRIADLDRQRFDTGSAGQFAEFVAASRRYIQAERQTLTEGFQQDPLTDPHSLTAAELASAGALSPRFRDENTLGQQHALIVRTHPADSTQVEALAVTFGGESANDGETARLALNSGPRAGLVHRDRPNEIWGASRQWMAPTSAFAGTGVDNDHAPTAGHLAALLSTNEPVPATDAGMRPAGILTSGDFVNAPDCGADSPQIYVLPVQFSDNGHGHPVIGVQAFAEAAADGSGWTVRLQMFHESATNPGQAERIELDDVHGRVAAFTSCG